MISTVLLPLEFPGLRGSKHSDGQSQADDLPHVDVQSLAVSIIHVCELLNKFMDL